MGGKIDGKSLKTWWKKKNLCEILVEYIKRNGIKVVHDFLSQDYRKALGDMEKSMEECKIEYIPHNYPSSGIASNSRRGKEVEKLIQNFEDTAC